MDKQIHEINADKLKESSIRTDEESYQATKEFQWLRDNISIQGVQTPLAVCKDDDTDKYLIIDGNRRFRAGIANDLKKFSCIIYPKEHIREIQLGVNVLREPLKPAQKSQYLAEIIKRTKKSDKEIMQITGIPYDVYNKIKALNELNQELQQLVNDRKIDYHAGHALKRLNESGQKKFFELVKGLDLKKTRVTRYVVRDIIKEWDNKHFRDGKKLYLKKKDEGYADTQRKTARMTIEKRVEEKNDELEGREADLKLVKHDIDRFINFFRVLFRHRPLMLYFKEKHLEHFSSVTEVLEIHHIQIEK